VRSANKLNVVKLSLLVYFSEHRICQGRSGLICKVV